MTPAIFNSTVTDSQNPSLPSNEAPRDIMASYKNPLVTFGLVLYAAEALVARSPYQVTAAAPLLGISVAFWKTGHAAEAKALFDRTVTIDNAIILRDLTKTLAKNVFFYPLSLMVILETLHSNFLSHGDFKDFSRNTINYLGNRAGPICVVAFCVYSGIKLLEFTYHFFVFCREEIQKKLAHSHEA